MCQKTEWTFKRLLPKFLRAIYLSQFLNFACNNCRNFIKYKYFLLCKVSPPGLPSSVYPRQRVLCLRSCYSGSLFSSLAWLAKLERGNVITFAQPKTTTWLPLLRLSPSQPSHPLLSYNHFKSQAQGAQSLNPAFLLDKILHLISQPTELEIWWDSLMVN